MESSLAYPRGKEEKIRNSKKRQNSKGEQTLGYLGVVKPVTPKEDVPLRGLAPGKRRWSCPYTKKEKTPKPPIAIGPSVSSPLSAN
ncbi:hypothetical protein AVEN_225493-1 [Araneus ventricosus]|uniref:Uncharacterized protein n=1 Tax=Araneus ventricosus TaxID=182803 RepID=A0A4Y2CPU9_ARAVE|nr:hypothetical protein AVEN_225493-1 [Araneus ventricosus]